MGFEVPPTRVSRRSSAPVLAGLGVTVVLLLAAVVLGGQHPLARSGGPAGPDTTAAALPSPTGLVAQAPVATTASSGRKAGAEAPAGSDGSNPVGLPPAVPGGTVRCHTLAPADCLRVARSAADLLAIASPGAAAPGIVGVEVWASLVCGDNLDCPIGTLRRLDPLGSASVSLAGNAGEVWVNVGMRTVGRGAAAARRLPEAWIVRWFH